MTGEAFCQLEEGKSIGNSKLAFSPNSMYFAPQMKRFPLELGTDARVMELPEGHKSLMISLSVSIQYRRVSDGQTDTVRRQRPRYAERRACNKTVLSLSLRSCTLFFMCVCHLSLLSANKINLFISVSQKTVYGKFLWWALAFLYRPVNGRMVTVKYIS